MPVDFNATVPLIFGTGPGMNKDDEDDEITAVSEKASKVSQHSPFPQVSSSLILSFLIISARSDGWSLKLRL